MRRLRTLFARSPRDQGTKIGFQSLAEELIQEVLQYLHWPTDFYNLSLVSRILYRHATNELYSTLVIAYRRPERISALLSLLQTRPERASLITTIVFDEDIKSIGPNLQDPEKWPPRVHHRELADGWDPTIPDLQSSKNYPSDHHHHEISRQLTAILPILFNLKRVIMRSIHPSYIRLGASEKQPAIMSNVQPFTDEYSTSTSNIWEYVFSGSPLITGLFVNGVTSQLPGQTMLSRLTTISISDLFFNTDGHAQQAYTWNKILTLTPNLKTLGMVQVEHVHIILDRRFFPSLEALELYKVFLEAPHEPDSQVFIDFLCRHSSTLRILALSSHLWGSVSHVAWLSNEDILPNLHTLRLDHTFSLLGAMDELVPGANNDSNGAGLDRVAAIQADKTNVILDFIDHRPNITDIGISALAAPQADKFARFLATTRPMRNIFIGDVASRSLRAHTSCTQRYWDYSYEAWAFYELFAGLAISKSGFRPRLPPQPWKFWKTTSP